MVDSVRLSAFTNVLRLCLALIHADAKAERLRIILKTVITENQILCLNTSLASLDRLIISLKNFADWKASNRLFEFLDHCIVRLVRKPVHYYEMLADLIATVKLEIHPRNSHVDLLLMTIMEQWRFLVEGADTTTVSNVSQWLVRLIEVMRLGNGYPENPPFRDESTKLLLYIRDRLRSETHNTACRAIFEKTLKERPELDILRNLIAKKSTSETIQMPGSVCSPPKMFPEFPKTISPPEPPEEREDHPGLYQWSRHEIQDSIIEGHVKALILCLCSNHAEIRKQALTALRAFMTRLEVGYSTYSSSRR